MMLIIFFDLLSEKQIENILRVLEWVCERFINRVREKYFMKFVGVMRVNPMREIEFGWDLIKCDLFGIRIGEWIRYKLLQIPNFKGLRVRLRSVRDFLWAWWSQLFYVYVLIYMSMPCISLFWISFLSWVHIFALDMECMVYVYVNCRMCYSMWWYIMLKINNTTHVYLVILPSCRRAWWWAWREMMVNRYEINVWHKAVGQTCGVKTKQNFFLLFLYLCWLYVY